MDFLQNHWVRVLGVLIAILLGIYLLNPPKTVCEAGIEYFQTNNAGLAAPYKRSIKRCQEDPSVGGCIEFFDFIGSFNKKIKDVGSQCAPELKGVIAVQAIIPAASEMFVRAAWGSTPPYGASSKNGFLDISQVAAFCRLRSHFKNIFGEDAWSGFVNRMLEELPGAKELGRNEAWSRSLMSDKCAFVD